MIGAGLGRCGTTWVLLVALVADVSTLLSVIGTRFIYPAGVSALTIRVSNVGTHPALVQAWFDRGDETTDPSAVTVLFILSPPLLRMDPQETQALQLRHTGESLPDDRESLFWVNLLEVLGREDGSDNPLLVSYRLRMKLLFRPQGLADDPRAAARQVVWRLRPAVRPGQRALLEADDRSPYHVSLVRLELGEDDFAMSLDSVILPPFAVTPLNLPTVSGEAARVHFDAVGDNGQIERGDVSAERYPQEFGRARGVGLLPQHGPINKSRGFTGGRKHVNKCYALVWNISQGCWSVVSEGSRRCGRPAGAKAAVASVLALLSATALAPTYALPSGGTVVGGSANGEIHLSGGNSLSVNQKVDRLIVNWDSFSVAAGEWVIFNQSSNSLIALNRVIGTRASDIQSRIGANGQVFLVNPNGVLLGRGVQVNISGLAASTLGITDAEFNGNSSRYRFTGPSTSGVLNQGGAVITAKGGDIALLGVRVGNRGAVLTQMDGVGLGTSSDLTLNFDGNKLLDIRVDVGVASALASNGGLFKADGGRILMAARTANALLNTVVNSQGVIEVRSPRDKSGWIMFDGGPDGRVTVGDALPANALNGPGHGGIVEVRGQAMEVALGTQVNTLTSNGLDSTWKIAADKIDVRLSAVSDGVTVHADTLSRNLASTNIELVSAKGGLDLNGSVNWASGNRLGLGSVADLTLNGRLNASGAKAGLELKAEGVIDINDRIVLDGADSVLAMDVGESHRVNGTASVSLAGADATYVSSDYCYTAVQNLAQLQAINKNLDDLYVSGGNILGGSYYCTALQSIGGSTGVFSGTLDGPGNNVGNLSISNTGPNIGLFARSPGTLSNLKLNNLRVSDNTYGSGPSSLGVLVGINSGRITNVSASGVSAVGSRLRSNTLGGLVGRNINGQITNASVSGGVTAYAASTAIGDLVGENFATAWGPEAVIENAHSNVHMTAQSTERNNLGGVGGLVGLNVKVTIRASGSQGKVETYRPGLNVDGLVGYSIFGHVSGSSASGQVEAGGAGNTGGLVGPSSGGEILRSQASGSVYGKGGLATGGLIGKAEGNGTLGNLKASGSVTDQGGADLGGLVGNGSQSAIKTTEAMGKVSSDSNSRVDGLIGYNLGGSVVHAISHGGASGRFNSPVGGLVGHNGGELVNVDASGRVSAAASMSVGGLVGSNVDSILSARSSSTVNGSGRSRIGDLAGENQIQGRIVSSMSEGIVSGDYYVSTGGLAGANLGSIEYSSVSGRIDFKPQSHYGQIHGAQVGENHRVLGGNYVTGEAVPLPLAGIGYDNVW